MKLSDLRTCEFSELLRTFLFPYLRNAYLQLQCSGSKHVCVFVPESVFGKHFNVFVLTGVKIPSFSQDTRLLSSQKLSADFFVCVHSLPHASPSTQHEWAFVTTLRTCFFGIWLPKVKTKRCVFHNKTLALSLTDNNFIPLLF